MEKSSGLIVVDDVVVVTMLSVVVVVEEESIMTASLSTSFKIALEIFIRKLIPLNDCR